MNELEWNKVNEILLELYTKDDERELSEVFLRMIKGMISYTSGFLIMLNTEDQIMENNSYFINISRESQKYYIDMVYEQDYIKYIYGDTRTIAFRDTDIIEDDKRRETVFYKEFLQPNELEYGCGILFVKEDVLLGSLNLFRKKEMGDFTEKEMDVLNKFKDHLTNIIYSLRKSAEALDGRTMLDYDNLERYKLSKRENEITKLMLDGMTNQDISEELSISISTVKKHIYNIFTKLGINSRMQLLSIFKRAQ